MSRVEDSPSILELREFFPFLLVLPDKREPAGKQKVSGRPKDQVITPINVARCLRFPAITIPLSLSNHAFVLNLDEDTYLRYDATGTLNAIGTNQDSWFCCFDFGVYDKINVDGLHGLLTVSGVFVAIHTHSRTYVIEYIDSKIKGVRLCLTGHFAVS